MAGDANPTFWEAPVRVRTWQPDLWVLTVVLGLALVSPGFSADSPDQTVYVTNTGKKYHSSSCQCLRKSKTTTTLEDAMASGLTACSRCRGGSAGKSVEGTTVKPKKRTASEPKSRSSATSSRCTATTKKGSRCKRSPPSGSSYCWQHK